MKKILFTAAGIAALSAFAAPAHAQEDGVPYFGPRVEALVGFDAVAGNTDDAVGVDEDIEEENAFGGVRVGFDMPLGTSAAIGIDLEASESLVEFEETAGTTTSELRVGRDLYAGGRISLLASDNGNLYITAGYTNMRLSGSVTTGTVVASDSTSLDGIRGGAGVQFNLGRAAFVGVEYRYSNYEADVRRHQVVGGFGFRF